MKSETVLLELDCRIFVKEREREDEERKRKEKIGRFVEIILGYLVLLASSLSEVEKLTEVATRF